MDYITDVEFMGCSLSVLTKVNNEQHSKTNSSLPHANDTLNLPTDSITFSNEDLCHLEPNHNQPLHESVEYLNKIICQALVDPGALSNLLPIRILYELGYSLEHLVPSNTQFSFLTDYL